MTNYNYFMSNYTYMNINNDINYKEENNKEENKEVNNKEVNNKEDECIICFEECNDELYVFCKKCNYKFHTHCFLNWKQMCIKKGQKYDVCLHCQNSNTLYKIKQRCCYFYKSKV